MQFSVLVLKTTLPSRSQLHRASRLSPEVRAGAQEWLPLGWDTLPAGSTERASWSLLSQESCLGKGCCVQPLSSARAEQKAPITNHSPCIYFHKRHSLACSYKY